MNTKNDYIYILVNVMRHWCLSCEHNVSVTSPCDAQLQLRPEQGDHAKMFPKPPKCDRTVTT